MNADHYRKVLRILEQSDRASQALKGHPDEARQLVEVCTKFWKAEFPHDTLLDLSGADLSGKIFAGASIDKADFQFAKLDHTEWNGISMQDAKFDGASIRSTTMIFPFIERATFKGADLSGSSIVLIADQPDFSGANLSNATITFTFSCGCTPPKATRAILAGCTLKYLGDGRQMLKSFVGSLTDEQRQQAIVKSGSCFIATAACGTEFAPEVEALRAFRDRTLLSSAPGRALIRLYEAVSPPIAHYITGRPRARWLVRTLVVRPAATLVGRRLLLTSSKLATNSRHIPR